MFKNQPKGLYVLALANTGERFGYYTMLAILLLFLQAKFGFSTALAGTIYSTFLALVYFMPMIGGWIADRWNFQKTVTLGIIVMFLGYLVMAIPTERGAVTSMIIMFAALLLISVGTGLFKGNLQVMVGDLYNDPRYSDKRDVAFSLFYMAINIGAMFAPMVTVWLCEVALKANGLIYNGAIPSICNKIIAGESLTAEATRTITDFAPAGANLQQFATYYMDTITTGYSYAFAVACLSMVISFLIYKLGARTYSGVSDSKTKSASSAAAPVKELTPQQTKSRITALLLVFAVVIFFWMVFHQNGATLTKFAEVFTMSTATGWTRIGFNIWALVTIVVAVYSFFSLMQSKSNGGRALSFLLLAICGALLWYIYSETPETVNGIQPQVFQQFNPFYVVALTPFSVALFGWLASKKKEPSAPRKIGYGMLVAAFAFLIMCIGSIGLGVAPEQGQGEHLVTPNLLIGTYLVLTFAELLLSPMGISFVSKVAPPKYKGAMMGCWFGATAIGNYLVVIPTLLWNSIDVSVLWAILIVICLISAGFIFFMMKRLEAATSDDDTVPANANQLETIEDDAI
ncbi:MAG: peptide MFS transporter [Firmicutes bacterium]|nr:peptide MFS transporter [Bacillota bacterium]MCM1402090.1 peptide MFS transporter [Bacteroides sp.]MCM1478021.1 peptide MFS transporter [Bacteroides sp.]